MINVIYEDNHLIAVSKSSSVLAQGDSTGDMSLDTRIKNYLAEKYNKPGKVFLGVIHRLDRPVSGVILFARTSKALSRLNEMFSNRKVKKTYLAIVAGRPPADMGTITGFVRKNEQQNKTYVFEKEVKGSKSASLSYRIAGRSDRYYLLEIELHTGRHHQIRAQLAGIGCPVKGDLKYGFPRSNSDGSICLHSRKLELVHPVKGDSLTIEAPLPDSDVWRYFRNVDV